MGRSRWSIRPYVELHAYQHHVFMDWRFVDDSNWELVISALNGAGVESMQAKWDEMFGGKKEEVVDEVKVKKPRKKAVAKKKSATKSKPVGKVTKKPTAKKEISIKRPTSKKIIKNKKENTEES